MVQRYGGFCWNWGKKKEAFVQNERIIYLNRKIIFHSLNLILREKPKVILAYLTKSLCYITKQYYVYENLPLSKRKAMKEKIKQLIAENLLRQGSLKLTLRNLEVMGIRDDERTSAILDAIQELEERNQRLYEILKQISES
jgi:hypothetical protein